MRAGARVIPRMPTKTGKQTRAETRAANRAAHAVAQVERDTRMVMFPEDACLEDDVSDYLPEGEVNGNVLRRKRGTLSAEACVNRVCHLMTFGMSPNHACRAVGVPQGVWFCWLRDDVAHISEKLAFAERVLLSRQTDEVIDIVDDGLARRDARRSDHVTLTRGAAALAVATSTLAVPFRPKASSSHTTR